MNDLISRQAAIDALSDIEVSKMEHCVGNWEVSIYRKYEAEFFCADGERRTEEEEEEEDDT